MNNSIIHKRRSIRLSNYDYSGVGLYFITLCTANRLNIFGEIINGESVLNQFGKIAAEEWENTPNIRKNISLGEYIIMPNHIHGIISIDYKMEKSDADEMKFASTNNSALGFHSPSQTIGAIIRGYKGATTKRINHLIRELNREPEISTGELQFAPTMQFAPTKQLAPTGKGSIWQRNYYEHIIKSEKAYNNISNYIINNPLKWKADKFNI